MNSVMDCMVSLSPLELLCFSLEQSVRRKKTDYWHWELVKAITTQKIRMIETAVLLQIRRVHVIFNRCSSHLFLKACRDGYSLSADYIKP